jgi:hypothetical protein
MRVGDRGDSSGIGGGVASNGWQLLLLALHAQVALGGEMHAPHHVVFTLAANRPPAPIDPICNRHTPSL